MTHDTQIVGTRVCLHCKGPVLPMKRKVAKFCSALCGAHYGHTQKKKKPKLQLATIKFGSQPHVE